MIKMICKYHVPDNGSRTASAPEHRANANLFCTVHPDRYHCQDCPDYEPTTELIPLAIAITIKTRSLNPIVTREDLSQIEEADRGATQAIARSLGMSPQELMERIDRGEISRHKTFLALTSAVTPEQNV